MIAIIDYGAGNLRSVYRALASLGYPAVVTNKPRELLRADGAVLPGVGAAGDTMASLRKLGLVDAIVDFISSLRPFLAVCLGMQVLFAESEEGGGPKCLGVIPGQVKRLPPGGKIPHMGWNRVRQCRPHPIWRGIPQASYFYFVHSYYAQPADSSCVIGETEYQIAFPSVVASGNVVATQFHPEKSGTVGWRLYENFAAMVSSSKARTGPAAPLLSGGAASRE